MKKNKKVISKLLAYILTAAMVLSMLPFTAFAEENVATNASAILGVIKSFGELGEPFEKSEEAENLYYLAAEPTTPFEELGLPEELTAVVERNDAEVDPEESSDAVVNPDAVEGEGNLENELNNADSDDAEKEGDGTVDADQPAEPAQPEAIPVTWASEQEGENGLLYTAQLPEGYELAEGVQVPQVFVFAGMQTLGLVAPASTPPPITTMEELQTAFDNAKDGDTIQLTQSIASVTTITVDKVNSVTLDLNGFILYNVAFAVGEKNNSSLTITDSLGGGSIQSTESVISNKGTGTIKFEKGSLLLSSSNNFGIKNETTGTVELAGGEITFDIGDNDSASLIGIINAGAGTINVSSGKIDGNMPSCYEAIRSENGGKVKITGGEIISQYSAGTITIKGELEITGGTIRNTRDGAYAIYFTDDNSTFTKTGGTIIGKIGPSYTVSGTITASDTTSGIAATLQLKDKDGNKVGDPVQANTSGVYTIEDVMKGTGYTIDVTMDGYEKGTISAFDVTNANVADKDLVLSPLTIDTFDKLQKAFNDATDGQTIKLTRSLMHIEPYIISVNKNISVTLDLNGNNLIAVPSGGGRPFIKVGSSSAATNLTITDTKGNGAIQGSDTNKGNAVISNEGAGTVDVAGGSIISISDRLYPIQNNSSGTIRVSGGAVKQNCQGEAENAVAIYNTGNGTVDVSDGVVSVLTTRGVSQAIYSNTGSTVKVSGGTVTINNAGNTSSTVYMSTTGVPTTLEITGGTVQNEAIDGNAIYVSGDCIFSNTGGTIIGKKYPFFTISGTITAFDAPSGVAATLQLKDKNGNAVGNPVTAGADGTYIMYDIMKGEGYTIDVTSETYARGTIPAFEVKDNTIKDLVLKFPLVVTSFSELQDAFNAAEDGDTIQIGQDISENLGQGFTFDRAISLNLDLNGYKITPTLASEIAFLEVGETSAANLNIFDSKGGGEIAASGEGYNIVITNYGAGKVIIEKGTISIDSEISGVLVNKAAGTVEIAGGEVKNLSSNPIFTLHNYNSGTIIVSGGKVSCNTAGSFVISNENGGLGKIIISGGEITSNNAKQDSGVVFADGEIKLSGGTITNTANEGYAVYVTSKNNQFTKTGTPTITGKIGPAFSISGKITGSDAPDGLAATLQVMDKNKKPLGSSVTANADGTYIINDVLIGAGYTVKVTMTDYKEGTIPAFDLEANAEGKDLVLTSNSSPETPETKDAFVTVNGSYAPSSGAGSYKEGTTVSIDAGTRNGYRFTGWTSSDGVVFANPSNTATTFVMPAKAVTVTAGWSKKDDPIDVPSGGGSSSGGGGGGGGSTSTDKPSDKKDELTNGSATVTPTFDNNGNANLTVTDKVVLEAIKTAQDAAKKAGLEGKKISVEIVVKTDAATAKISATLPKIVQETLISNKVELTNITTNTITIGFTQSAINKINKEANADVTITAEKADTSALSEDAKKWIGTRPFFDLNAIYGDGQHITDFGDNAVTVSIPYVLGEEEEAENVFAVYIDENGKPVKLFDSYYDEDAKAVVFKTSHFSNYGVGYEAKANTVSRFIDIEGHWAKADIEAVAEKGILAGTGENVFSPDMPMTRGMFVTALGRMANIDTASYQSGKFTDVKVDEYYAPYINWAAEQGIVVGVGTASFAPNQNVTRQEMAVIVSKYAKATNLEIPETVAEVTFADGSSIGAWAAPFVKEMQMAGLLSGKNANQFDPLGTATRAEVSALLNRFVNAVVDKEAEETEKTEEA